MNTGMLWFDNSSHVTLKAKVEQAAAYYRKKYHLQPNLCLIHPTMFEQSGSRGKGTTSFQVDGILVRPYRSILPGHLWIGVEEAR